MNKNEYQIIRSEISEKVFFDKGVEVVDSKIGSNVSCYKFSSIIKSKIGYKSIVGDMSKIDNCVLDSYNKIEKYNHLYYCKLKENSYTGAHTIIMYADIGKYCSISWGCSIGGAEHDYQRISSHAFYYNPYFDINEAPPTYDRFEKDCIIENDVWIGCNSTILRGVTIGNGAVIAANSLVNKDVPPYAIVAGSPAKIIKYRFNNNLIEKLLELEWWNLPKSIIKENFDLFDKKLNIKVLDELINLKKGL